MIWKVAAAEIFQRVPAEMTALDNRLVACRLCVNKQIWNSFSLSRHHRFSGLHEKFTKNKTLGPGDVAAAEAKFTMRWVDCRPHGYEARYRSDLSVRALGIDFKV